MSVDNRTVEQLIADARADALRLQLVGSFTSTAATLRALADRLEAYVCVSGLIRGADGKGQHDGSSFQKEWPL